MPNENEQLKARVGRLEYLLNEIVKADRYEFSRTLKHAGAKLGLFNVPPVAQPIQFFNTGNVASAISFGAGGNLTSNTTSNGGIGSTYYFWPDEIRALKQVGILPM